MFDKLSSKLLFEIKTTNSIQLFFLSHIEMYIKHCNKFPTDKHTHYYTIKEQYIFLLFSHYNVFYNCTELFFYHEKCG